MVCLPGLMLIGGASLAQPAPLVQNGGFETGNIDDMPGWEKLPWAQGVEVDAAVFRSGQRSIRAFAHGGVRSKLVPYAGGRVRVSAWVKTDNVVRGAAAAWHKAAIQLISYDENRRGIGHIDVALVEGTTDWTRHERTALLSRDVALISVHCHIWGEDVSGTAWFDDVEMQLLDDPATLARKPLDLGQATVTVDFEKVLGPFRHLWIGSDVSYMDRTATPTQINAMRHARQFGFRYIRMHDCVHDPGIYSEDAGGNPVHTWDRFDTNVSAVVDNGMWPVIVLETMPPELATRDDGRSWTNPYPPRDDQAYGKWQRLTHEIVKHCRERWGDDIHNWYFEVWNEPDASGYFNGTLEEYLRIYDHAVAGATSADPDIRVGGPGGAGTGWCRALLQHCQSGRNDATGGTGCRIDFLSWHIYTVGVGIPVFDNLRIALQTVREVVNDFPDHSDLPTLITEWGCSSSPHPVHDRPYDAAFRVMAVREFMDYGITLALPFALGAGPPHAHEGFQGGLALFTKTTIPKPSFRAFELLHRMIGTRVECESSNDPVGGLACIAENGKQAWVMLYNLIEKHTHDPYETDVTVALRGPPGGDWSCSAVRISAGECDPYLIWQEMGGPEELTDEQHARLLKASELPGPRPADIEGGRISFRLPGFSVALLELTRP